MTCIYVILREAARQAGTNDAAKERSTITIIADPKARDREN